MKTLTTIFTFILAAIQLNAQSFIDTYIHIVPDYYGGTGELVILDCANQSATITKTITFDGNPLPTGQATGIISGVKNLHYFASDGTYTYEFEADINFNSQSPSITYTLLPAVEPLSVIQTHLSSSATCNGEINLITSGGNPPVYFNWFQNGNPMLGGPGQTSQTGLCPGNYGYTFGDASTFCPQGNGMMFNLTIEEVSCIISTNNVTCYGACDGIAEIIVTGAISGVVSTLIMNSNGDQDQMMLIDQCPGSIIGQVMDITGAMATCQGAIVEPDLINFDLSVENSTGFELDNGYAMADVTVGDGPYDYNWSGPGGYANTGDSIGDLAPGNYSLEITYNGGNCDTTVTFDITEPTQLMLNIISTTPQTVNPPNGAVDFTISGGVQPYDTILDNGQTQVHGGPFDELPFGNYTLKVVDFNNNSVETTFTINTHVSLEENQQLNKIKIYPNPTRDFITVEGEDVNSAIVYDINGRAVINQSLSDQHKVDLSHLEPGVYTIVIQSNTDYSYIEKLIVQ